MDRHDVGWLHEGTSHVEASSSFACRLMALVARLRFHVKRRPDDGGARIWDWLVCALFIECRFHVKREQARRT